MKKVNLLLLLGLLFVSNSVFAKTKIHCNDSSYVGKTMFKMMVSTLSQF